MRHKQGVFDAALNHCRHRPVDMFPEAAGALSKVSASGKAEGTIHSGKKRLVTADSRELLGCNVGKYHSQSLSQLPCLRKSLSSLVISAPCLCFCRPS
jgi:hypothetical protein